MSKWPHLYQTGKADIFKLKSLCGSATGLFYYSFMFDVKILVFI